MTAFLRQAILIAALLGFPATAGAEDRWFAPDKAKHFGATAAISGGSYGAASTVTAREKWRVLIGAGGGLGAAAAKEFRDRSHGDASWRDFTWGAVGTAAGVTVAWAINRAFHRRRPAPFRKPNPTSPCL
jgi:putative lipoprotein